MYKIYKSGKHRAAERWKITWNNDTNRLFFVSSDRNKDKKNIWQTGDQMGISSNFRKTLYLYSLFVDREKQKTSDTSTGWQH